MDQELRGLAEVDPAQTLAEIAEELRMSPATIRSWISKGTLRAMPPGSGNCWSAAQNSTGCSGARTCSRPGPPGLRAGVGSGSEARCGSDGQRGGGSGRTVDESCAASWAWVDEGAGLAGEGGAVAVGSVAVASSRPRRTASAPSPVNERWPTATPADRPADQVLSTLIRRVSGLLTPAVRSHRLRQGMGVLRSWLTTVACPAGRLAPRADCARKARPPGSGAKGG